MHDITVGIDWGSAEHFIHLIEHCDGGQARAWRIQHTPDGIRQLVAALGKYKRGQLGIAVERKDGLLVDTLVEAGFQVFSLNPLQLDRFRDRFSVGRVKDDALDARVLAHCLRTDLVLFDQVVPLVAWQAQIRRLSRLQHSLTSKITRAGNRLHACLELYFPQMLAVSNGLTRSEWILDLIELVPSADHAAVVDQKEVATVLRRTKLDAADVLETLGGNPFEVAAGVQEASEFETLLLVEELRQLRSSLARCLTKITEIIDRVEAETLEDAAGGPPTPEACDIAVLRSFPGVGDRSLAGLIAEVPHLLRERDYRRLRATAGVAPVTRGTGKRMRTNPDIRMRRGCNSRLRQIIHYIAMNATRTDHRFRCLYQRHRANGQSEARALRAVGDRLLRTMMACLRDGLPYDRTKFPAPTT